MKYHTHEDSPSQPVAATQLCPECGLWHPPVQPPGRCGAPAQPIEIPDVITKASNAIIAHNNAYYGYSSQPVAAPHPESFCQECGGDNPVWFAPNIVWNKLVPQVSGILCPNCFIKRNLNATWKIEPEPAPLKESAENFNDRGSIKAVAAPTPEEVGLTFAQFSAINRQRCESPDGFHHQLSSWSTSDWFTALMGELGEAANVAKKLNRYRDGVPGNKVSKEELQSQLRKELGDVFVYLDLLAQSLGESIADAAIEVFNAKSDEIGCPIKIDADDYTASLEARRAALAAALREVEEWLKLMVNGCSNERTLRESARSLLFRIRTNTNSPKENTKE